MLTHANLNTYTTDLGEEGIDLAKLYDYDLILLDLDLPDMNGHDVLRQLRLSKIQTPILILSGSDDTENKIKGFGFGADDYLTKPFSLDELYARVRTLLRRSTTRELLLQVDNLTLNPKTKEVQRAGTTITLSAKEYRLLEYLMRKKGAVVSEEDIITHGWAYDYDTNSNIVAVYIRYIRNKVDKAFPGETPLIQTVRGLGYKIQA